MVLLHVLSKATSAARAVCFLGLLTGLSIQIHLLCPQMPAFGIVFHSRLHHTCDINLEVRADG